MQHLIDEHVTSSEVSHVTSSTLQTGKKASAHKHSLASSDEKENKEKYTLAICYVSKACWLLPSFPPLFWWN